MTHIGSLDNSMSVSRSRHTSSGVSPLLKSKTRAKITHANELLEISTIASSDEPAPKRAKEILGILHSILPFAAAQVSQFDPADHQHSTLVNTGYEKNVSNFLDEGFVQHDELYKMMRYNNYGPLRWADTPFDYRRTESAQKVFIPAGFDEGFSACLFSSNGRYVGALHTSVEDRRALDNSVMNTIQWVQKLLTPLVDSLRPVFEVRRSLAPEASAFLITKTGKIILETAMQSTTAPDHYALLAKMIYEKWRTEYQQGFARRLWRTPSGEFVSVQIICVTEGLLVALENATLPHSLSYRELEIITLAAYGKTNIQIANRLTLSPLTVAKHLEKIREKTGTSSRVEMATKARNEGMLLLNL